MCWSASLRARRGKEEFGQANFNADVLPEPAGRLEIVKHVTGYGKILSKRDLKLEMAPQEVISTDRHIGLRDPDRQSGNEKSAVCADLLASPRLLYANGGKKKRARIIAQEGLDIVRRPLRQRIVCQDSGERGARRIDHLERTVAVGMERCVGNQIKKQPIKAWRKLSKSFGVADLRGVGKLLRRGDIDRTAVVKVAPERQPPKIGEAEPALDLRVGDEEIGQVNHGVHQSSGNTVVSAGDVHVRQCRKWQVRLDHKGTVRELSKIGHPCKLYPGIGVRVRQRAAGGIDESVGMSKAPVLERNEGPDRKRPALVISRVCSWVVVGGRDCGCIASDDAAEHRGRSSQHDAQPRFRRHLSLLAVRTAEAGLIRKPGRVYLLETNAVAAWQQYEINFRESKDG